MQTNQKQERNAALLGFFVTTPIVITSYKLDQNYRFKMKITIS